MGGGAGEVVLEWASTTLGVTYWQYRQRERLHTWSRWSWWTDVRDSDADTTTYRVTGLEEASRYGFQVRPWTSEAGPAYEEAAIKTAAVGPDGIPYGIGSQLLERGRTFQLVPGLVFDVPEGMLVSSTGVVESNGEGRTITLFDHLSGGSALDLDVDRAMEIDRYIIRGSALDRQSVAAAGSCDPRTRDVDALFDQIVGSLRTHP